MPPETLDFEEPIAVLLKEIEALSLSCRPPMRGRGRWRLERRLETVRADPVCRAHAVAARPRGAPPEPSRPRRLHSTPVSRLHPEIHGDRRFADDHAIMTGFAGIPRRGGAARRPRQGSRYEGKDLPELRIRAAGGLSKGHARFAWPKSSAGYDVCSTRRPHIPASTPRNAASPKRSPSTCAT